MGASMGSAARFSASLLLGFLLSSLCGVPAVRAQDLRERDALCDDRGCYVVYFQRKTFLEAWRACKNDRGNLATVKRAEDAHAIAALFTNADLRDLGPTVRVWIGLQRQPKQCKPRPLRGYSWTTGDLDTEYTNWQREESPGACSARHCVAMEYDSSLPEHGRNFEWLDGACYLPTDGYLCRFTYEGMCPALWGEGGGNALYTTPFNLLTTMLTHLPAGSVATVPCPGGTMEEQMVLCVAKADGDGVAWSREAPLCGGGGGGGDAALRRPRCMEGYLLAADGLRCVQVDACQGAPCQFECVQLMDGYRCACPEGYMLAPDELGCLDVDECLQSPCDQLCVNSPGSFECSCLEGYQPAADDGECEDVDECASDPCEQACENTPGSHICHCHMGFSVSPDDPRHCQETDECQIPGTCEQMCVNYVGGFDCYCEEGYELGADHYSCQKVEHGDGHATATLDFPWATRQPGLEWNPDFYDWPPEHSPTDWPHSPGWLTDPPGVQSADVILWVTSGPLEEAPFLAAEETSSPEAEDGPAAVDGDEGERFPNGPQWEVEPDFTSSVPTHTPPPPTTTHTPTPPITTRRTPPRAPTTHTPPPPTTTHTPPPTATHRTPPRAPTTHTTPLTTGPTTTPDYYEYEEATTSVPAPLMSTIISEGAWNWFWNIPTPATQVPVPTEYEEPVTDYSISADSSYHGEKERDQDRSGVLHSSQEPKPTEEEQDNGGDRGRVQRTTPGWARGEAAPEGAGTWLLVGLLVPICIAVVATVAVGVVHCTRRGVQPRSKNTTDCYHWISGAHDKRGAPGPSAAGRSHV